MNSPIQSGSLLAPLVSQARNGRPRTDDRRILNGMVYKIRTEITWRDLPERYGPWQRVYTRFRCCTLEGVSPAPFSRSNARMVPRLFTAWTICGGKRLTSATLGGWRSFLSGCERFPTRPRFAGATIRHDRRITA
jgi:transposase